MPAGRVVALAALLLLLLCFGAVAAAASISLPPCWRVVAVNGVYLRSWYKVASNRGLLSSAVQIPERTPTEAAAAAVAAAVAGVVVDAAAAAAAAYSAGTPKLLLGSGL